MKYSTSTVHTVYASPLGHMLLAATPQGLEGL